MNTKHIRYLILISILALGIGSGFTPWVYRPPVALQLTAPGLAEYVKFLPEMRLGLLSIQRIHFLLPLMAVALGLPLLVVNKHLQIPWGLTWLLRLGVLPMALAILSPVWAPGVLLNDEFRFQTMVAGLAVGLAIIAPLFKRLPLRWVLTVVTLLTLFGVGLALRQFYLVNEAIAATYASPVALGWGGYLTVGGVIGLLLATGWVWKEIGGRRFEG